MVINWDSVLLPYPVTIVLFFLLLLLFTYPSTSLTQALVTNSINEMKYQQAAVIDQLESIQKHLHNYSNNLFFVIRVRGLLTRARCLFKTSNDFLSAGIARILKRQLSGRALKYTHFELKQLSSPKVNFQSYFELDWFYDLFLYSSEFGMYWSTLLWSRQAIFLFLASGAVACICCLLVFFLFFIYDLNQERNNYQPWVNWTSGRRATAVDPSVCLSVWTVPWCFVCVFVLFGYVKRGWPQKKLSNSAPKSSWANFSKQLPCFLCTFPLNTLAAPIVLRTALDLIIIVP